MIISGSWTISFSEWNCKKQNKQNNLGSKNSSDLQRVEEVEDHLQERTEDHSDEADNNQDDDVVVRMVFLRPSTDGLIQKLMPCMDVEAYGRIKLFFWFSRINKRTMIFK